MQTGGLQVVHEVVYAHSQSRRAQRRIDEMMNGGCSESGPGSHMRPDICFEKIRPPADDDPLQQVANSELQNLTLGSSTGRRTRLRSCRPTCSAVEVFPTAFGPSSNTAPMADRRSANSASTTRGRYFVIYEVYKLSSLKSIKRQVDLSGLSGWAEPFELSCRMSSSNPGNREFKSCRRVRLHCGCRGRLDAPSPASRSTLKW